MPPGSNLITAGFAPDCSMTRGRGDSGSREFRDSRTRGRGDFLDERTRG